MRSRFRSRRSSELLRPCGALIGGLACGLLVATSVPAFAGQGQKGCVRVEVSTQPDGKKANRFFASEIEDLHFRVVFKKRKVFEPNETLELNIYLPEGHLFKTITVPVAAPEAPAAEQAVEGHPFPKRVRRARREKASKRPVIHAPAFPVAGTQITRHSLYGRWTVEAWADGAERPCRARFKLKP